jgi:hypothetical protein
MIRFNKHRVASVIGSMLAGLMPVPAPPVPVAFAEGADHLLDAAVRLTYATIASWIGERAFRVRDPNGVIVQLLDWNAAAQR